MFAPIPGNIGLDSIKAGVFNFLVAVGPEFLRAAEIMECAAVNKDVLAVNGQALAVIANAIRMQKRTCRLSANAGQQKRKNERSENEPAKDLEKI